MEEKDLIETKKVLESYGQQVIDSMKNILISNNKDASGDLIRSLKYDIVYNDQDLEIEFSMIDYGQYVDSGRRPGTFPNISAISKWASIRGISQKFVFPIAKKIKDLGIKPTPFFETSVNENKDKLISDLSFAYSIDLDNYIQKQIDSKFQL